MIALAGIPYGSGTSDSKVLGSWAVRTTLKVVAGIFVFALGFRIASLTQTKKELFLPATRENTVNLAPIADQSKVSQKDADLMKAFFDLQNIKLQKRDVESSPKVAQAVNETKTVPVKNVIGPPQGVAAEAKPKIQELNKNVPSVVAAGPNVKKQAHLSTKTNNALSSLKKRPPGAKMTPKLAKVLTPLKAKTGKIPRLGPLKKLKPKTPKKPLAGLMKRSKPGKGPLTGRKLGPKVKPKLWDGEDIVLSKRPPPGLKAGLKRKVGGAMNGKMMHAHGDKREPVLGHA